MWPTISDRRPFLVALTALVALAWATLWLWGRSPEGRFLGHEELAQADGAGAGIVVLFVAGWTLMTIAMMLPTSLPLVALFHSVVRDRSDRPRLVGLLVAGYLAVWTLFGALAHGGDRLIHEAVARSPWLEAHEWAIAAGTILLAGAYEFAPLKHRCLEKCRSPFSFIAQHWHGGRGGLEAFRLGAHHGAFCVGCCWSLMLLMFAVGIGNLGWMLALAAVMALEKNLPWGRLLAAPVGAALLGWGSILVLLGISTGGA